MPSSRTEKNGRIELIANSELLNGPLRSEHFAPQYWQQRNAITGTAGGRNLAYFIEPDNELCRLPMVLRHYYRGGLVGKINQDSFLRFGTARSVAEFSLLRWMYQQGLPVPRPIAAQVKRSGLSYQADILIEQLPCDSDLFGFLSEQALPQQAWRNIGEAVGALHAKHVFHSDLNCHNILVAQRGSDSVQVWLIDFDKCHRRQPSKARPDWQQNNLARLRRSLQKEQKLQPGFAFDDNAWQAFLAGYESILLRA